MPDMINIRKALITLPNPVAALLVNDGGEKNGMIASWITQVSFDPPKVLVAVHPDRYTHAMIHSAGYFTLNLLSDDQAERVPRLKLKGDAREEKFSGLNIQTNSDGQPFIADAAAVLHCKLSDVLDAGDHTLFIGTVTDGQVSDARPISTITLGKGYTGQR